MKKALLAIPGLAAVSSFASTASTAPSWWPTTGVDSTVFDGVLTKAAPIAIAVVVGVAGVHVVIKLINRGAGK